MIDGAGNVLLLGKGCGPIDFDPGPDTFDLDGGCNLFVSTYDAFGALATGIQHPDDVPRGSLRSAVYPNPFTDYANVTVSLERSQSVHIALFDVLGRRMAPIYKGNLIGAKRHQFEIDGSGLPSGVYTIRIEGEDVMAVQHVVLRR